MQRKKKIVITSGYFNPLHIGHINLFREAKRLGDVLIVIVNNDEQVKLKRSMLFMPENERMEIVKAIKYVDEVFLSIDNYAEGRHVPISKSLEVIASTYPGAKISFAKGGDRNSGNIPESEVKVCRGFNIKIINGVGGDKIQSSSWLLKNIFPHLIHKLICARPVFYVYLSSYFLILLTALFWDKFLAIGIIVITLLSAGLFFTGLKVGIKSQKIYLIFLIALVIHLLAASVIYYTNFYPFGGGPGDQTKYHQVAAELSERFRSGDFSIDGFNKIYPQLYVSHFYPVLLAILYTITAPSIIIGTCFNVWLVALSIVFLYLIVKEIGGSDSNAFGAGLVASVYPSYLYYGSLLLREALVISLALFSILFIIKLIKKFSWKRFFIFYIGLGLLTHFRFYIGYAFFPAFILSIPFISNLNLKKKIIYGVITIISLGFLPQIFSDQGYYGINSFKHFLKPETIVVYREVAYAPPPPQSPPSQSPPSQSPPSQSPPSQSPPSQSPPSQSPPSQSPPSQISAPETFVAGSGSTTVLKTELNKPLAFAKNYFISFVNVFLGPFPWQLKYKRHLFVLLDTILWYFLLFFIVKGFVSLIKNKKVRLIIPIIVFSFSVLGMIALIMAGNFGVYTRMRMPTFIALLCFVNFDLNPLFSIALSFKQIFNGLLKNRHGC